MAILSADVGGTKTRLGLFESQIPKLIKAQTFQNKDFICLEQILSTFLQDSSDRSQVELRLDGAHKNKRRRMFQYFKRSFENVHSRSINPGSDLDVERAVLAVAGPVKNGTCQLTNLPWFLDEQALAEKAQIPSVQLIHDFESVIWGTAMLEEGDSLCLKKGQLLETELRIALGAGTGFGLCGSFLNIHSKRRAFSNTIHSEFGHTPFTPNTPQQWALLQFAQKRKQNDFVTVEHLLSGEGLFLIYEFVLFQKKAPTTAETRELLRAANNRGRIVGEQAISGNDEACIKSAQIFWALLASVIGNICLTFIPQGGVYIGGGIAKKLLPFFQESHFRTSLKQNRPMQHLLDEIEIHLILQSDIAILGGWLKAVSS